MSFVAKGKALKEDLVARLGSSTYSTKTRGERTTPAARPAGEGVYTIASIASTTHLAYILTQPDEPGEVQKAFGIHAQGSFVVSTKNPESNAQGNQLPGNAKFSSILQNEFGSRSWLPMKPQHLTYDDCGLLLIGEKDEKVEEVDQDHVLSDLHTEDVSRESLHQIFEDLGLSLKTHQSKPLLGEFA